MMTMLKPQSSPYTVPSWVKWGGGIIAGLVLLSLIFFIWMYTQINQDRTAGHEQAAAFAVQKTNLTTVDQVETYNGETEVFVVKGEGSDGESSLVFINEAVDTVLTDVNQAEVLSEEQLISRWSSNCPDCRFKDVSYGYEEEQPVFELVYTDEQGRYVLDYFTLSGDSFDQRFAFRQNN